MKTLIAAAAALVLGTAAFADGTDHAGLHVPLENVEWTDAPIPGVQLALAWGDDASGATWLVKIAPGAALPMHTHTHDYWGLNIQGTWTHLEPGGIEVPSAPGDHALVKGGDVHGDRCDSDVPCIVLLDFAGPRDVAIAEQG